MTTVEDAAPASVAPAASTCVTVHVTGAFLTGCALQIELKKYREIEDALDAELDATWQRAAERRGAQATYASGGGFSSALPLVIARRTGKSLTASIRDEIDRNIASDASWEPLSSAGWTLELTGVTVDVYDFGVAVLDGAFRLDGAGKPLDAETVRLFKRAVSLDGQGNGSCTALAQALVELARETHTQFADAARRARCADPPTGVLAPSLLPDEARDDLGGRLLWLHPVHVLETSADPDPHDVLGQDCPVVRDVFGGRFAPGIGSTVYIAARDLSGIDAALRLTRLLWAVHAYSMWLDRALAYGISRPTSQSGTVDELTRAADDTFTDYLRITQVRARIDSVLAELGGDEQRAWDAIAEAQCLPALSAGIDRKVALLRETAERHARRAAAAASDRINRALAWITTLAIVGTLIAGMTFFHGDGPDPDASPLPWLRWTVIGVGLGAGVMALAYCYSHRWRQRAQRFTRLFRGARLPTDPRTG